MQAAGLSLRNSSGAIPQITGVRAPVSMTTAMGYGSVGGRLSSGSKRSAMDTALLWIGVLLAVVGILMVFLFAANISVDCALSPVVADRIFDVCRVRQQSGWVAPGSYWMTHSRSVLVSAMDRAVLIANRHTQQVVFGVRDSGGEAFTRNDLAALSARVPGEEDDENDDDHAAEEDILAHSKCLVGVEAAAGQLTEVIPLTLVPRPCLGDEAIALLREVQSFVHHRHARPADAEEEEEAAAVVEPSMGRFSLYEETGFLPQLTGFGLVVVGAALLCLYGMGGIERIAALVPS